ncbi:MAG: DUF4388 domain-containing protein [Planctomycetota bacterium]|nr:MAG: DUF4388 domain-containing protein [Planctomycetota bacterium]
MTLKGSLEVLNLSDIFQSLSMNQHTGTLRVSDGRRERMVYFSDGEITLLSTDKKLRIGDLLVREGKISQDDLEYALEKQRASAEAGEERRLGEILVEEGFVSEADVAAVVRRQIEEAIYDLFLWKQAEFEFLIDYCPESLQKPGHNITRLRFNTGSLIMEAMRRLDEWEQISAEIPSRKEVFRFIGDEHEVMQLRLPPRLTAEIPLIDGERNVEQLLEESSLGEFELYKLLYELKRHGLIEPLTPEELSDRAEEAYARGRFRQSVALYERLAEVLPKNRSIRLQLAEALRAYGDDKRALEHYAFVAEKLEQQKNYSELARTYRAMLDIAPDRQDVRDKLRELDRAYRRAGLRRIVLVLLVLGALGVGGYMLLERDPRGARWIAHAKAKLAAWWPGGSHDDAERLERERERLRALAQQQLHEGRVEQAFATLRKLRELLDGPARDEVTLPVRIRSLPPGKEVVIDGVAKGRTDGVFFVTPGKPLTIELREDGRTLQRWEGLDPLTFHDLFVDFYRKPLWTFATGAAVRSRPVVHDGVAYFPSLDGYLYGVRLRDHYPALRLSLRDGALDPFGEAVSDPAVVRDQLVVGNLDGNALVFDLGTRHRLPRRRVADRPLLAAPVIVEDGQTAVLAGDEGSLVFFSLRDNALVRSVPVCVNRISAPLLAHAGTVYAAGEDNRVVAVDLGSHGVLWQYVGRDDYRAGPCVAGDRVIAGDRSGELVCLGARDGALHWRVQLEAPVVGLAASPDGARVVVSAEDGRVATYAVADGEELWNVTLPGTPGEPVCDARAAYVCTRSGALRALDLEGGVGLWSSRLPVEVRGRLALHEGRLLVGAEDGRLYAFATGDAAARPEAGGDGGEGSEQ